MFTMLLDPIAFSIGTLLDVHWYGIILGAAALAGLLIAVQEGKRFGLNADFFLDLLLIGVPSSIIAARLYYVAFKWDYYQDHPGEIIQIWNGGIAIYGALIGALLSGFFYIRAKGYSFWRIADICAPSLLIGQMIGRWGNFVNQEAYGGEVEESFLRETLHLPNFIVNQMNVQGVFHHPTFLYESLWSLVGLIILFVIRRRNFLKSGELLFTYFIWYSIGRFFIEALRTDSLAFKGPEWLKSTLDALWSPMTAVFEQGYLNPAEGNIRISQLLALLLVIGGIILIATRRKLGYATEKYNDPLVNFKTGKTASEGREETGSSKNDANGNKRNDADGGAANRKDSDEGSGGKDAAGEAGSGGGDGGGGD
ncbi:prolipoprotein diacylglyceryl transferase [Cohnella sp. SGD-V74]|uniref:prolipoprotein diacylglyceryl transferase n=1 Tax=unclassified Cohnella TaxID=2636738 RepID=UPI000D06B252|nr:MULTISPECIES: prolipoprotein diacylglyceryl transferase [unclassified Cohnella]PRX72930.1 prolipoprotein diacylglyceryl transferase [Cohnella sp. SGD-V74]